eukprot:COSAG05_NODE_2589_length_2868_cov_1.239075_3_plen_54_part_00
MDLDGASYDTKLGEMRGLSALTYLHARFCQVDAGICLRRRRRRRRRRCCLTQR